MANLRGGQKRGGRGRMKFRQNAELFIIQNYHYLQYRVDRRREKRKKRKILLGRYESRIRGEGRGEGKGKLG